MMASKNASTVHQNARADSANAHPLQTRDRLAHLLRAVLVAAEEPKETVLIDATLLQEMRCELFRGHRQRHAGERRPQLHFGEEEIGGSRRFHAAQALHGFVLGEEPERHRRRAGHELVQEDRKLPAGAIDDRARGLDFRRIHLLDAPQLALDFVGEGDRRLESQHLDGADRLVNLVARLAEEARIGGRGAKRGEPIESARERLPDLDVHPRQRAQVEIGRIGRGRHSRGGRCRDDAVKP